jgi:hypothetical protein
MSLRSFSGARWVSVKLLCLLVLHSLAPGMQAQVASTTKLKIMILEGEGSINNIRLGTAREPLVQIQDENDRPVAGALVMFTLPDQGASGVFADGTKSLMVQTDSKGQAMARGLKPNKTPGQFKIRVDASHQGTTTSSSVAQSNIAGGTVVVSAKVITILAIVGGAVAAGVVAASQGGSETANAPTSITPGSTRVGPP